MKFLIPIFLLLALASRAQDCNVNPPSNLQITGISSCQATLHWSPSVNAVEYKVRHKVSGSNPWFPKASTGTDTFFTFTGLNAGVKYEFNVRSICGNGSRSKFIKYKETTLPCTIPFAATADSAGPGAVQLSAETSCTVDTLYFRYRRQGDSLYTIAKSFSSNNVTVTGILSGETYEWAASACPLASETWTPTQTFTFNFAKPNILVILLDDTPCDYFSITGAPSFVQTPSIDRIAKEGVQFNQAFVTHALCAPSRATMYTGLYSFKTGVQSNVESDEFNLALPNIFEQLDSAGYFTALVGKNQFILDYDEGYFDYWLDAQGNDSDHPIPFSYLGQGIGIPGYLTDILTDSAVRLIEETSDPLFIWMSYRASHTPLDPTPASSTYYLDEDFPFYEDTLAYQQNFPSWLDDLAPKDHLEGPLREAIVRLTHQVIQDVDRNVERLLEALEAAGKLENTMILFTSDHGHMLGEHTLNLKRVAYDPSIRIPLFIRYPAWFPEPGNLNDQFASNLDIAPTILDAAGIEPWFALDGYSLRDLYEGQASRSENYIHYRHTLENKYGVLPSMKAVRDFQYKYIHYDCTTDTTEEFFDMVADPMELTNLVNHAAFAGLVQTYRDKLANLQVAAGDTISVPAIPCYLKNPVIEKMQPEQPAASSFILYPNPAGQSIQFRFDMEGDYRILVTDLTGRLVYSGTLQGQEETISLEEFPPGVHFAEVQSGQKTGIRRFVVSR